MSRSTLILLFLVITTLTSYIGSQQDVREFAKTEYIKRLESKVDSMVSIIKEKEIQIRSYMNKPPLVDSVPKLIFVPKKVYFLKPLTGDESLGIARIKYNYVYFQKRDSAIEKMKSVKIIVK